MLKTTNSARRLMGVEPMPDFVKSPTQEFDFIEARRLKLDEIAAMFGVSKKLMPKHQSSASSAEMGLIPNIEFFSGKNKSAHRSKCADLLSGV